MRACVCVCVRVCVSVCVCVCVAPTRVAYLLYAKRKEKKRSKNESLWITTGQGLLHPSLSIDINVSCMYVQNRLGLRMENYYSCVSDIKKGSLKVGLLQVVVRSRSYSFGKDCR